MSKRKSFKKSTKGSKRSGSSSSKRERNIGHKNGEEHSIKKKGGSGNWGGKGNKRR